VVFVQCLGRMGSALGVDFTKRFCQAKSCGSISPTNKTPNFKLSFAHILPNLFTVRHSPIANLVLFAQKNSRKMLVKLNRLRLVSISSTFYEQLLSQ